ncbi:MAG: N-acetylneuraminate synthase family protein [Candidatus Falkowbacteria bacterium]
METNTNNLSLKIRKIGIREPVFVIAEIGINHNGDINIAKQLIDVAVKSGADAVKFQKRTIDIVYTTEELAKPRENPFGTTNGDLKRALELGQKEYEEINKYCKEKRILWFASCWDEASVDFMNQFNPVCYKIASACLTDDGLLKYTRAKGKPIILSTGMSTIEEIYHAVEVLGREDLSILHCVATYPAQNSELNLSIIKSLQEKFPDIPIGYSGHEVGLAPSLFAVVLGATIIERHITLNRSMWGSDQSASIEPQGFERLVRDIRTFEDAKGDGIKRVLESEIPIREKLRRK